MGIDNGEVEMISNKHVLKNIIRNLYRASHVLVDLGWVDLDLGSSPGLWAAPLL